jgi:hypothetical protein
MEWVLAADLLICYVSSTLEHGKRWDACPGAAVPFCG